MFDCNKKVAAKSQSAGRQDGSTRMTQKILVFTDGACLNNGQPNPKAGWAFVYGPETEPNKPQVVFGRLEREGPFGDAGVQSSNRAELRAAIAALRFRYWVGEGFRTIVIATDSEYTAEGCTKWIKIWIENGWKTNGGADVKNRDLWEMLLGEVERWDERGLAIHFWRIPREWNSVADAAAKRGVGEGQLSDKWMDVSGILGLTG